MLIAKGYTIESAFAESEVDDYEKGQCGEYGASWDVHIDKSDMYDSIAAALKSVCKSLCFDDDLSKHWFWDSYNGEFVGDFLVDDDNEEVTEKHNSDVIESWKNGKTKLWNCRVTVKLSVVSKHDLLEIDVENWRNEYESH